MVYSSLEYFIISWNLYTVKTSLLWNLIRYSYQRSENKSTFKDSMKWLNQAKKSKVTDIKIFVCEAISKNALRMPWWKYFKEISLKAQRMWAHVEIKFLYCDAVNSIRMFVEKWKKQNGSQRKLCNGSLLKCIVYKNEFSFVFISFAFPLSLSEFRCCVQNFVVSESLWFQTELFKFPKLLKKSFHENQNISQEFQS